MFGPVAWSCTPCWLAIILSSHQRGRKIIWKYYCRYAESNYLVNDNPIICSLALIVVSYSLNGLRHLASDNHCMLTSQRTVFSLQRIAAVDYSIPSALFLSADLSNLLSQILVSDPKKRATLSEIQQHPWFCSHLPQEARDMNDNCLQGLNVQVRMISTPPFSLQHTLLEDAWHRDIWSWSSSQACLFCLWQLQLEHSMTWWPSPCRGPSKEGKISRTFIYSGGHWFRHSTQEHQTNLWTCVCGRMQQVD